MSVDASLKPLVAADLLAVTEHERYHELIGGKLVRKATPSARHGLAQAVVAGRVGGNYNRRPGGRRPGGWWIVAEVEI